MPKSYTTLVHLPKWKDDIGTSLWMNLQTLFNSSSVFFFQDPIQMLHCMWPSCLLSLLRFVTASQSSLFFINLTVSGSTGEPFCTVTQFEFVWFPPPMIRRGYGFWGKKSTKVNCPSRHDIMGVIDINTTSHWWRQPWYLSGLFNKVQFFNVEFSTC